MNFSKLNTLEDKILKSSDEYEMRPFTIPVKNENLILKGVFTKPLHRAKFFHDVAHTKERIVLHYTAGQLRSDLQALSRNDFHVSVAFVIARNGIIHQLFPSKFWSGHIGKGVGNIGTGNAEDKKSIGIELSNYGYLVEKEGNLETVYSRRKDAKGNVSAPDVYCSLAEQAAFKKLTTPFRKQSFYATFTPAQYDSLIILLRYLTNQYNIPRAFLPEPVRYETTDQVKSFRGIVSHVNYRSDGKWDIGQAFDWDTVISGVQAPVYTSILQGFENASQEEVFGKSDIHSEEALEALMPEAKDASQENDPYEELEPAPPVN